MGSCAAPSAKGDDKFITTDYLQQCPSMYSECIMICILKIAITYNDLFFVAQLKRICSNKCKDINA
ncbi:hypothetical protein ACQGTP_27485, partial [Klebsiella pneumoniae]